MTTIQPKETYLSPSDAARLIHQTQKTLRSWVKHGLLTDYRTSGGHRRYLRSELLRVHERKMTK
ncbi:MAG: MerR family DNA-binding transcriptional regulator [Gammaproteobacteria bacterium]